MFKNQTKKKKSKHNLITEFDNLENDGFKNTCLGISLEDLCAISIDKINKLCGIPKKNAHIRIVTRKAINAFDFIQAICNNEIIEELTISVYRIGGKVLTTLTELKKANKIKIITILINDGFPKLVPDVWNKLKTFECVNFKIKLENNHTKILLMKTNDNYYCVEGSGNLSINARIEQYCFDNNKQIYDFHYNWIKDI